MKTNDDMKALLSTLTANMSSEDLLLSTLQGMIAGEISMRRQELGMSQKALANKLGVSQGLVSRWERGESNFNLSTLVKISIALGLDLQSPIIPTPPITYPSKNRDIVYLSSYANWKSSVYHPMPSTNNRTETERELQEM